MTHILLTATCHKLTQCSLRVYSAVFFLSLILTGTCFGQSQPPLIISVQVDHNFIRQVLLSTLFTGSNQQVRLLDDGSGCNFLELSEPNVSTVDNLIRIHSKARAKFGQRMGKQCFLLLEWYGQIESFEQLFVAKQRPVVKARVVKSNLLNTQGKIETGNDALWQRINEYIHPQLESVVLDLTEVRNMLHQLLPTLLEDQQLNRVASLVDSLSINNVEINPQGALISFSMQIPPRVTVTTATPELALTDQEMVKIDQLFREFDSFITLIIKQAAIDALSNEMRDTLLEVLLDVRYDIITALQNQTAQTDPVRTMFLDTWQRLAPILRQIATTQNDIEHTLHYLSFVTAIDALKAIDALGSEIGIDISSDGLKRLARVLIPHVSEPLKWHPEVDQQLRELFDFSPLSAPLQSTPPQSSLLHQLGQLFIPLAYANVNIDPTLVKRLNRWIPQKKNLSTYLPLAEQLIRHQAQQRLASSTLEKKFHSLFLSLVPATAWQESCWRQFVNRKGKRVPLKSNAGAVGMMQIVPRIWRGFYNQADLKWDIVYNIQAGSEILMRYLQRYAIRKKEHIKTGHLNNLARATYAAYNAGPRKLTRYRQPNASARQKRVDKTFYERFLTTQAGHAQEVATCY